MSMNKIALATLLAGLLATGGAFAADKSSAEAAIAAAKAAQKAAGAAGGEWRDTGKMIAAAEKALAEGNYGNAESMAKKAEAQGMLGKQQAVEQHNVGNPAYLYN